MSRGQTMASMRVVQEGKGGSLHLAQTVMTLRSWRLKQKLSLHGKFPAHSAALRIRSLLFRTGLPYSVLLAVVGPLHLLPSELAWPEVRRGTNDHGTYGEIDSAPWRTGSWCWSRCVLSSSPIYCLQWPAGPSNGHADTGILPQARPVNSIRSQQSGPA